MPRDAHPLWHHGTNKRVEHLQNGNGLDRCDSCPHVVNECVLYIYIYIYQSSYVPTGKHIVVIEIRIDHGGG